MLTTTDVERATSVITKVAHPCDECYGTGRVLTCLEGCTTACKKCQSSKDLDGI